MYPRIFLYLFYNIVSTHYLLVVCLIFAGTTSMAQTFEEDAIRENAPIIVGSVSRNKVRTRDVSIHNFYRIELNKF